MTQSHTEILKEIALRGGAVGPVMLSSGQLAEILGVSQQSASKRILSALKDGLLSREMGVRTQALRLTQAGIEVLRREWGIYRKIFEHPGKVTIKGSVVTGLGEGQYYLNHKEYNRQFGRTLGYNPYAGTLNLKVSGTEASKATALKSSGGINVRGFKKHGRTFGEVRMFPCTIGSLQCAVIFPSRSHYDDTIEIISKFHLRRTLGLKDGDEVVVEVNAEQ